MQNKKGIVLIITLWIIVVLAVVSLAMVRQISMEVKMVGFQRDIAIVDSLALAGLRQAIIVLREDRIKDSGEMIQESLFRFGEDDHYQYDGGTEEWADFPDIFEEVPFYQSGDHQGYYYVDIEDESAKLPINNARVESIAHLIELTGVDEDDAISLAAAIQDFKDPDHAPDPSSMGGGSRRGGGGGGGKGRDATDETSFYNGRMSKDQLIPDVVMKNTGISTMDDLLLVPGMTPEILFGNVDPDEQPTRRRSRGRRGQGSYLGLVNYMSVYASFVNLNTVKQEVMEAVLYPVLSEKAQRISEDWVKYRDGSDGQTYTRDDKVLKTPNNDDGDNVDITRVNGMSQELLQQAALFQVASDVFEVKAFGEYQGIKKGYKAIIRRRFTPWESLPEFGVDIMDLQALQQVTIEVVLFEPLFDAKKQLKTR